MWASSSKQFLKSHWALMVMKVMVMMVIMVIMVLYSGSCFSWEMTMMMAMIIDHWSYCPLIILTIDHVDHWSSWSLIVLISVIFIRTPVLTATLIVPFMAEIIVAKMFLRYCFFVVLDVVVHHWSCHTWHSWEVHEGLQEQKMAIYRVYLAASGISKKSSWWYSSVPASENLKVLYREFSPGYGVSRTMRQATFCPWSVYQ